MSDWATVLGSALDHVEYGIVLLDKDLRARFINRSYYDMLRLAPPKPGSHYSYVDLVEHARSTGLYDVGPKGLDAYAAERVAMIRAGGHLPLHLKLTDGRIMKAECMVLPDGGRMLTFADVTEFVRTAEELRVLAATDELTRLMNRRRFIASLNEAFKEARERTLPLSVLMYDADRFKNVNDSYGHHAGDEVLRGIASLSRTAIRGGDTLGRLGGDEFAALLPATPQETAWTVAEELRTRVAEQAFELGGQTVAMTVSIGIAMCRESDQHPHDLLRRADQALYSAKAAGRNRVVVSDDRG